ncbi:MAG: hypothetical protein UT22_C0035G0002 [Parcubacteria group bacterium GW2011_GWC2_39_11]|nr:MAG: hypothetical protein UT22_C0035G0002 [Parcubacteria group bacterium GW2011_GWC2_39_11]
MAHKKIYSDLFHNDFVATAYTTSNPLGMPFFTLLGHHSATLRRAMVGRNSICPSCNSGRKAKKCCHKNQ